MNLTKIKPLYVNKVIILAKMEYFSTDKTKILLPAAFLIVPNSVQLKIRIVEHFPFTQILNVTLKAKPTEI